MSVYYVNSKRAQKYDMTHVAILGDKTIAQLRNDILVIPNFCRDESSIEVSDLLSYIGNGITMYSENSGKLNGIINFDINVDKVIISGLCAPGPSIGVGSQLLYAIKSFAELNKIKTIHLTCYGGVVHFYDRNGFRIQSQSVVRDDSDSDSDSDSDDEKEQKIRYNMTYTTISGGKKRIMTKGRITKGRITKRRKQNKKSRRNSIKSRRRQ